MEDLAQYKNDSNNIGEKRVRNSTYLTTKTNRMHVTTGDTILDSDVDRRITGL